jgi:HEAT repeat protein
MAAVVERDQIPFYSGSRSLPRISERSEPELIAACKRVVLKPDPDWRSLQRLEILLLMTGNDALAALREIRDATRQDDRRQELHALAAFGVRLHESTPAELVPLLMSSEASTREAAARVITTAKNADLRDQVAAYLDEANPAVRGTITRCLLAMGDVRGVAPQLDLTFDRSCDRLSGRCAATYRRDVEPILALGAAALPTLEALANHTDPIYRVAAAGCQLRITEPELAAAYDLAIAHYTKTALSLHVVREPFIQRAGKDLARAVGAEARLLLEESAVLDGSRLAVYALGELADARSIPALVQAYPAGSVAVGKALAAMGEAGIAAARQLPQLDPNGTALRSRSRRAGAAIRTLFDLDDLLAVPRLLESLERTKDDPEAHRRQVDVLLADAGEGGGPRPEGWKPDHRLLEPLLALLRSETEEGHDSYRILSALANFRDQRLVAVGRAWTKRCTGGSTCKGLELLIAQRDPIDRCATLRELLDDKDPTIRAVAAESFARSVFLKVWREQPARRQRETLDRLLALLGDEAHAFTRMDMNTKAGVAVQVRDTAWGSLAFAVRRDRLGPLVDDAERTRILPALAEALADGRYCRWYYNLAQEIFTGWTDAAAGRHILAGYRLNGERELGLALVGMPFPPALPELARHLDDHTIVGALDGLGEAALPHLLEVLTEVRPPGRYMEYQLYLRDAAIRALGKLGKTAAPAWDAIQYHIADPKLRMAAFEALHSIDRVRARPLLERMVVSPQTDPELVRLIGRLIAHE